LDVHLVMDNYAIHKPAAIRRWLARHHAGTFTSRQLQHRRSCGGGSGVIRSAIRAVESKTMVNEVPEFCRFGRAGIKGPAASFANDTRAAQDRNRHRTARSCILDRTAPSRD